MVLAQKVLTNSQLQKIIYYWKSTRFEGEEDVLDAIRRYDIRLRVSVILRGSPTFFNINCRLAKRKHIHGHLLLLELKDSKVFFTPFIVGFILGSVAFIFFISILHCLAIGAITSVLLGSFYAIVLLAKAPERARTFLDELVNKSQQMNSEV